MSSVGRLIPKRILSIASKYGLNSSCLAVEILEDKDITGEARQQMMDNLTSLKEKGISILLDDFGSGYTTFCDLQNLAHTCIDYAVYRVAVNR